jgi:hypothetical protein
MVRLFPLVLALLATAISASAQSRAQDDCSPSIDARPAIHPVAVGAVWTSVAHGPAPSNEAEKEVEERHSRTAVSPLAPPAQAPVDSGETGFQWKSAVGESMLFLGVQHTFRMTELKTRRELGGPFFRDWFDAVKSLRGWDDGGRQFTNYVAHPMQGAISGYIQIQNDPKGIRQEFGRSKAYWKSRMKAMGWAAIWSTQFELGPVSQASIGNVGAGEYEAKKMAYVDLVITPTVGTAWLVAEDAIDAYLLGWIESRTDKRFVRNVARMALNPMRSCANVLRFKPMWHRDTRQ